MVDLFDEFSESSVEFLQYDNGYRSWRYTYAQVGLAARQFAAQLTANNICKGDKAILWSENRPEWIAAFWGCVLAGVIVVPIDYRASARFLKRVQEIVDARLILVGEEVQLPLVEGQPPVWRLRDLEWTTNTSEIPTASTEKDDVVEIVFTSGATGEPKGVLITHHNILANLVSPEQVILTYRKWFAPLFPIRFLCLIPLSHMFGQMVTMFIVPLIPGIAVFMHGYSPHEIVRQIRTRRVSVLVGVPKILELLQKQILFQFAETRRLPLVPPHWIVRWWRHRNVHSLFGWKFWAFIVGAAPLARELEKFWSRIGFAVIQGYGLTETAPVVTFNNPFDIKEGTVGKPVAGVEVKIAPNGEILVRGESVTSGYYRAPEETASAFEDGWFLTGDIGMFDEAGNLTIRGRKKEMIVTPEGLNVFPEDVEGVLNKIPGVREAAVVGRDRVSAILVVENGIDPKEIIRRADLQLEDHQKIRNVSIWPGDRLPRTEGTQKLKHGEIQAWVESGAFVGAASSQGEMIDLLHKYGPDRGIAPETTLDELGLSSLDRVELMIDLERQFDTSVDETLLTGARTVSELAELSGPPSKTEFPAWNRLWAARITRIVALNVLWLPLTRMIAHARISGLEQLASLRGPVIFAPNHQSHLDMPLILSALPPRFRHRIAVAMWKEYFDAHFWPERHTRFERFCDSVTYWLVALCFNGFPVPQTEAGARQSLRYLGDLVSENWSILYFPEGERTEAGEIRPFQPGVGLIAGRLGVPVVPVRLRGVEKVLHRHARWPRPGPVEIVFGTPLYFRGEDYTAIASEVEEAVKKL
ncbi:MAG TPA: AMP-binding protein [Acidobacteriota bacterium]|nr:AMP-binding protein [Acidobacteriota bacterium]